MLEGDAELRLRLLVVLGTSEALGEFLAGRPEHVADLGADERSRIPLAVETARDRWGGPPADALRVHYYRKLLHVAARDLTALTSFEESSAKLSDLAVATLGAALRIARAERGRRRHSAGSPSWRWARPAGTSSTTSAT